MQAYDVYRLPTGTRFKTPNGRQGQIIRREGEKWIHWWEICKFQKIEETDKMTLEIVSQ